MTRIWDSAKLTALLAVVLAQTPSADALAASSIPLFKNGHDGVCLSCHGETGGHLYTFVPRRCRLTFRVNASYFGIIEGRYRSIQGGFLLNQDKPERSAVAATVRADDVETGDLLFDLVLTSESFFDAGRHPFIVFLGKDIRRTGESTGRLVGDLTLRGITRPIVLDVTFKGASPRPEETLDGAGFVAKGSIDRRDFGITFVPSGTDERVTVTIEVEGSRMKRTK